MEKIVASKEAKQIEHSTLLLTIGMLICTLFLLGTIGWILTTVQFQLWGKSAEGSILGVNPPTTQSARSRTITVSYNDEFGKSHVASIHGYRCGTCFVGGKIDLLYLSDQPALAQESPLRWPLLGWSFLFFLSALGLFTLGSNLIEKFRSRNHSN
jgi:hypothetical protein